MKVEERLSIDYQVVEDPRRRRGGQNAELLREALSDENDQKGGGFHSMCPYWMSSKNASSMIYIRGRAHCSIFIGLQVPNIREWSFLVYW